MSQARTALQKDELWELLLDTVHALPMYNHHKRYVQEVFIKESPDISARELAVQINIPLGEAVVLLDELRSKVLPCATADSLSSNRKSVNRTLLDFDS
jgi:hypothetical protein